MFLLARNKTNRKYTIKFKVNFRKTLKYVTKGKERERKSRDFQRCPRISGIKHRSFVGARCFNETHYTNRASRVESQVRKTRSGECRWRDATTTRSAGRLPGGQTRWNRVSADACWLRALQAPICYIWGMVTEYQIALPASNRYLTFTLFLPLSVAIRFSQYLLTSHIHTYKIGI